MKKLKFLWSEWMRKLRNLIARLKGETPKAKPKPKPMARIGSVERFDTTPKRKDSRPVRLGQVNNPQTVRLGQTSYDLPKTLIPGQDGILDGDGEPEFTYEILGENSMTPEEQEAYRLRMEKDGQA